MKLNLGKFILIFIYVLCAMFMIKQGIDNKTLTGINVIFLFLNSIYVFFAIYHSQFFLPRQFIPLNELNAVQKTWRVVVAVMAISWGSMFTFGAVIHIITGKATIGILMAGSIFAFVAYAGVKMLTAK